MASTVKRYAAGVLAVWFSFWSVVFPITAHAAIYDAASNLTGKSWFVPGVGTSAAGNRTLAAAATVLGRANPWIAGITLGMPIAQAIIEYKNGSNPVTPDGLPLPPEAGFAPSPATLPTPPGWEGPDSPPPSAESLPGSATGDALGDVLAAIPTSSWKNSFHPSVTFGSKEEACSDFCKVYGSTVTPTTCGNGTSSNPQPIYCTVGGAYDGLSFTNTYACPDGFLLSGTTCTRSVCPNDSPVLVNGQCYTSPTCPDGYIMNFDSCILAENAPYKVKWPSGTNGNIPAYVPDPANPGEWKPFERNSPAGTPSSSTAAAQQAAAKNVNNTYTQDEYGNPVWQQVTPNPNGGLTYTQQVQTTNGTQTTTTTNTYTLNAAGQVTNVSTVTNNGPITNVSNSYASSSVVDIPNDYNKEATQQKILTGEGAADAPDWNTSVNERVENLGKGITDLLDPITGQFQEDKGKWFSWVWTPPVGSCSPFTGNVHNKSVTWDICPYVEMVRNAIGWVFSIVGAWVIYNNLFRRED